MRNYEITPELAQTYTDEVHREVNRFQEKYTEMARKKPHLWGTPSQAALHNYALSLLNIEFFKLGKEYRESILDRYK